MVTKLPKPTKLLYASAAILIGFSILVCSFVTMILTHGGFHWILIPIGAVAITLGYFQYAAIFHYNLVHTERLYSLSAVFGEIIIMFLTPAACFMLVFAIASLSLGYLISATMVGLISSVIWIHANEHLRWSGKLRGLPDSTQSELSEMKFTLREIFLLVTVVAIIFGVAKLLPNLLKFVDLNMG